MKNNCKFLLAAAFLLALASALIISSYLYINDSDKKDAAAKISVIVYGAGTDRWATMKQGLDQGAADFNAEINFVAAAEEKDAKEQELLLEREIENGAEGIILSAADSRRMSEAVEKYAAAVPIVLVETGIEEAKDLLYISADNYSMGFNIGRSVYLNSAENKTVAVFVNNLQRNSVLERYEGFKDSLQFSDCDIRSWEMAGEDTDILLFLKTKLEKEPADIIVAFDDRSLEAVIDAVQAAESRSGIYGIGSTNKIVHYLDYGIIASIVFENEFNMGYLSVRELMNAVNNKEGEPGIDIEFRTVNRETMYLPKNQRLVFPIVQ